MTKGVRLPKLIPTPRDLVDATLRDINAERENLALERDAALQSAAEKNKQLESLDAIEASYVELQHKLPRG